jgi:Zn finger protein HypA/HybF involved in hydrogenase expression
MHEHHKIVSLLAPVFESNKNKNIKSIIFGLKEFTSFDETMVRMYIDLALENTPHKNIEIIIKKIPNVLHCKTCNKDFNRSNKNISCPICNNQGTPKDNQELYIEHVEVL